jgi:hypothetical protein
VSSLQHQELLHAPCYVVLQCFSSTKALLYQLSTSPLSTLNLSLLPRPPRLRSPVHGGVKMPPRSSLTSSFSITDSNNEVVCPLRNQDGSSCRKRCIGEKRYRSMQEHIRRAHPEHYVPKLPATEESFLLMINTPPSDRHTSDTSPASAVKGSFPNFASRRVLHI